MATLSVYLIGVPVVLLFSAILSMAGLGAAFLFVPFFYWLGVPLEVAMPAGLLLNFVSLSFASAVYVRGRVVDFRAALPIAVTAVVISPLGAQTTRLVDTKVLLWLFSAFLVFAGSMMLFYKSKARPPQKGAGAAALGAGVGGIAVSTQEMGAAIRRHLAVQLAGRGGPDVSARAGESVPMSQ
jgi:uncharacterized membrane protein YfcA